MFPVEAVLSPFSRLIDDSASCIAKEAPSNVRKCTFKHKSFERALTETFETVDAQYRTKDARQLEGTFVAQSETLKVVLTLL